MHKPPHTYLTRRAFMRGGAGMVLAGTGLALGACGNSSSNSNLDIIEVSDDDVVTLDSFTLIKSVSDYVEIEEIASYDAGTMLRSSSSELAAALCTGDTARPLTTLALVNLASGTINTVLDASILESDGFTITDAMASAHSMLWIESNYLTSDWVVYSAKIHASELTMGKAIELDSGDSSYDLPEIAIIEDQAYWIVQPAEDSDKTDEDSLLKIAAGKASATAYTSSGRFNGGLTVSGQTLTATPRADVSGVYYQPTAIRNGNVVAREVLPHSYKPGSVIYMGGDFAFSIPASYDYGGGIANVGTYYPMPSGQWLRLAKTPLTPPGLCNGWFFCKSGSRTVFVDMQDRRYFTVDAPDGTEDYGDYSVHFGRSNHVDNYATVTKTQGTGSAKSVVLRRITPIDIT